MGHLIVTIEVVVVVNIYIYYYYYYDSGHFQVAFGLGCRGAEQRKAAGGPPAAFLLWGEYPDQTESNRTRLSMNFRRMLPVGPFRCFAMIISAMFFGYSWSGCIWSHSSSVT